MREETALINTAVGKNKYNVTRHLAEGSTCPRKPSSCRCRRPGAVDLAEQWRLRKLCNATSSHKWRDWYKTLPGPGKKRCCTKLDNSKVGNLALWDLLSGVSPELCSEDYAWRWRADGSAHAFSSLAVCTGLPWEAPGWFIYVSLRSKSGLGNPAYCYGWMIHQHDSGCAQSLLRLSRVLWLMHSAMASGRGAWLRCAPERGGPVWRTLRTLRVAAISTSWPRCRPSKWRLSGSH